MGYRNMQECLLALEEQGQLVRIREEMEPNIEIGVVQRRVFQAGGPALLFENVRGTRFPMVANVFGTLDRVRFLFRDTLGLLERLFQLKVDPLVALKQPWKYLKTPLALYNTMPKSQPGGPVMAHKTTISELPHLKSWPLDGGAYVTLPQVYSESPNKPGFGGSNLGMYRVQLTGNDYQPDREVGLHYQIHRGLGHHHSEALAKGESLPVNVFVGGPPAMTMGAIMPLPDGMPELFFAGALAGHRMQMVKRPGQLPILAQADFCICGHISARGEKPEGPFGDHLGYYSLAHDFPVLTVDAVYHRDGAVWPFTTVGRPPQEDTMFGAFIHELTSELVPTVFSGVHEVHAVDAAGVHPLLLAVGSERYVPYAEERRPQELLTNGMALLGTSQTSLSKYVLIAAREDDAHLSAHHIPEFIRHMLERVDLTRDLHFVTRTTMDTLDYSGISLNQGSKLLWASCGPKRRTLAVTPPSDLSLPPGFSDLRVFAPGILVVRGPAHKRGRDEHDPLMNRLANALDKSGGLDGFPLVVCVDDAEFTARDWDNFLWVAFTRSDPATDMYGAGAFTHCKHWGCTGPLVLDGRLKTYHAPPLEDDPDVERRVDALGAPGGPLHGII
ncbi:UbiD family decarboxylase [Desulfovibrio ferrophilus]|uniref:UbiD family decarboxylase n=1 Tax=Desulfovibrio ferrophilus TaxID=241368 RepID=A0A2Z6AYB7_9BACT|nr:UbiD family decarboxylase [Desulfovibrio ferrophilus]BBD08190.1 UbiD family decarboxylase [Desulfovibrio ferrophilus]